MISSSWLQLSSSSAILNEQSANELSFPMHFKLVILIGTIVSRILFEANSVRREPAKEDDDYYYSGTSLLTRTPLGQRVNGPEQREVSSF